MFAKCPDGRLFEARVEQTAYDRAISERQAIEELGLGAVRVAVRDDSTPPDDDVDRRMIVVRGQPPGTRFLFHCHVDEGRAATFMLLYDMLRNAGPVCLDGLTARLHLLGGFDALHRSYTGWKDEQYAARAAPITRFHQYASTRDYQRALWTEIFVARALARNRETNRAFSDVLPGDGGWMQCPGKRSFFRSLMRMTNGLNFMIHMTIRWFSAQRASSSDWLARSLAVMSWNWVRRRA